MYLVWPLFMMVPMTSLMDLTIDRAFMDLTIDRDMKFDITVFDQC